MVNTDKEVNQNVYLQLAIKVNRKCTVTVNGVHKFLFFEPRNSLPRNFEGTTVYTLHLSLKGSVHPSDQNESPRFTQSNWNS